MFSFNDTAMKTYLKCYEDAKTFFDTVDGCFTGSSSDAEGCSCFDSLNLDTLYDKVVACSTSDANKAALKEKKACKKSKTLITVDILNILLLNIYLNANVRVRGVPEGGEWLCSAGGHVQGAAKVYNYNNQNYYVNYNNYNNYNFYNFDSNNPSDR